MPLPNRPDDDISGGYAARWEETLGREKADLMEKTVAARLPTPEGQTVYPWEFTDIEEEDDEGNVTVRQEPIPDYSREVLRALMNGWDQRAIEFEWTEGGAGETDPGWIDPVDLAVDMSTGFATKPGRVAAKMVASGLTQKTSGLAKAGGKQLAKAVGTEVAMGAAAGGIMQAADTAGASTLTTMLSGFIGPTATKSLMTLGRRGVAEFLKSLNKTNRRAYRDIVKAIELNPDNEWARAAREGLVKIGAWAPAEHLPTTRDIMERETDITNNMKRLSASSADVRHGVGMMALATPGAAAGLEREDDEWRFNPERAILGIVAMQTARKGLKAYRGMKRTGDLVPVVRNAEGRFYRGGVTGLTGADWDPLIRKHLRDDIMVRSWDNADTIGEAIELSKHIKWLEPTIVRPETNPEVPWGDKNKRFRMLRYKPNAEGYFGNDKMAFGNEAYPKGRNSPEWQGCGRSSFALQNNLVGHDPDGKILWGFHPEGDRADFACLGGACYAESIGKKYGKGIAEGTFRDSVGGPKRREVLDFIEEKGLDAAQERFPQYEISPAVKKDKKTGEKIDTYSIARPWGLAWGEGKSGVMVTDKVQDFGGQDIRFGIDTDGSAWLVFPEVLDALLEANPRTVSVYSSSYHKPPPPHALSDRTIVNVTISGWHPLPETLKRLEWARQARDNGWNVILREITADPKAFPAATAQRYNRIHELVKNSDFFIMEQPLHYGASITGKETFFGDSAFGYPSCCVGSKKNPRTCDACEVAEGLGGGFRKYWGAEVEEGGKVRPAEMEDILPGLKQTTEPAPDKLRPINSDAAEFLAASPLGALYGLERDEEGNWHIDEERAIQGMAMVAGGTAIGTAAGRKIRRRRAKAGAPPHEDPLNQLPIVEVTNWEEALAKGKELPEELKAHMESVGQRVLNDDMLRPLEKYSLNINQNRLNTPEDINNLVETVAKQIPGHLHEARRGETITLEDMKIMAAELGMNEADLLKRKRGDAWSFDHILAARWIQVDSAQRLMELGKAIREGDDSTETLFSFAKRLNRHAAIMGQLSGLTAEAGRALRVFGIDVGLGDIRRDEMASALEHLGMGGREGLIAAAVDLTLLDDKPLADINQAVKAARKATWWDVINEVRVGGMLSGILTHFRNLDSNFITMLENPLGVKQLAAQYGKAFGWTRDILHVSEKARFLGSGDMGEVAQEEAMAWLKGAWDANVEAVVGGAKAFWYNQAGDLVSKAEMYYGPAFTRDFLLSRPTLSKIPGWTAMMNSPYGKAFDYLGEVVRGPGRLLLGGDELFKIYNYRAEIRALAYRTARKELGRAAASEDVAARANDLVSNPTDEMVLAAREAARLFTYTNEIDSRYLRGLQTFMSSPFGRLVNPFFRTPFNILRFANARTPFAVADPKFWGDLKAGGAKRDMALARATLGSMVMGVGASMAAMGWVTGNGPSDPNQRRVWELSGNWRPWSIKMPWMDRWVSYNQIEPIGMILGLGADMYDIISLWDKEVELDTFDDMAIAGAAALSRNFLSKTWTRGAFEALNALMDSERYMERYMWRLGSSFMPFGGLSRTIEQGGIPFTLEGDPTYRAVNSAWDAWKEQIPWLSATLPPRRDLWGWKVEPENLFGFARWCLPAQVSKAKNDPVVKEMVRIGLGLGMPRRTVTYDGVEIELSPSEYDRYVERQGHLTMLKRWPGDGSAFRMSLPQREGIQMLMVSRMYREAGRFGKEAQQNLIKRLVNDYRAEARKEIKMEFSRIYMEVEREKAYMEALR